jgi:beta-galactosidase
MAAVRVRVLDQFGSPVPYAQLPVTFTLTGPAHLVGPATVTAEGGMCGTYLRTTGEAGDVMLTISTPQTEPVTVAFRVTVAAVTQ